MNKLLILVIVLLTTILSFVVYAVSQQANEQKSANEVIGDLFNPQSDELSDRSIVEKRLKQTKDGNLPSADAAVHLLSENANASQPRMLRGSATRTPMKLEITPALDDKDEWNGNIEILFTNTSEESVKFLKPLDGSFWGWYQPHYKFSAVNSEGKSLNLSGRCGVSGLWADTEFPKSYLVELEPNESQKVIGYLPFTVTESGEHSVSLEYIYNYADNPPTIRPDGTSELTSPVEGVWQGTLESNEITLELKKQ